MRDIERRHTWLLVLALVGCSREPSGEAPARATAESRCQRGVAHLMRLLTDGAPPSAGERTAMDGVALASLAQCEIEGLSEEQLRCIESATTTDAMLNLGTCAAIAARPPGWLILPPSLPR